MFLVKGEWYDRDELLTAIASGADITADDCFDADGRFIVSDWADTRIGNKHVHDLVESAGNRGLSLGPVAVVSCIESCGIAAVSRVVAEALPTVRPLRYGCISGRKRKAASL